MTANSANLKKDITETALSLDASANKIKELSKGMDMEVLEKVAFGIWDQLQSKHREFLDYLPEISKDNFELIPVLKFIYNAVPLLAKQRKIDSSALRIYEKLNEAKDLIVAGEEPLKKYELASCNRFLSKSEEVLSSLKKEFEAEYGRLKEVNKLEEQIRRYKQHLKELVFNLIKQIILITEHEIKLFESIPFLHLRI